MSEIYAPDYLRNQKDKQLHAIADLIEKQIEKIKKLHLELEFTKQYLDQYNTSFRDMMHTFHKLSSEQKDKLIDLSRSLAALSLNTTPKNKDGV